MDKVLIQLIKFTGDWKKFQFQYNNPLTQPKLIGNEHPVFSKLVNRQKHSYDKVSKNQTAEFLETLDF